MYLTNKIAKYFFMDRIIQKKKWTPQRIALISLGVVAFLFISYQFLFADRQTSQKVDREKVTIGNVVVGSFQETIVEDGTVVPYHTRYLDAIEGGVIQDIHLKSGAIVEKGDVIMTLNNTAVLLDVLNREAQLYEQINLLRNTRLSMEQNSLSLQTQLAEIDYRINLLKPRYERNKALFEDNLISKEDFEAVEEEYLYNLRRREYTYESFLKDSMSVADQLRQLNESEKRMIQSLATVGRMLENLTIKAPINGILSTPQLELGQSVSPGQRLGQVDELGSFKVRAEIDEIYLSQIDTGLDASFTYDNKKHPLRITKIYPNVSNGVFEVDLAFLEEIPKDIKRGLSVRLTIALSKSKEAVLVPRGSYFQSTAGQWAYVIGENSDKAVRKEIKLGRKNLQYYEVVDGLEPGDQIITSTYDPFNDKDVIILE